ncbi:thiamine-phosphate pyrophosphorylase [Candidatus Termititenax dinenymphae]|uniref:Thiamine-phosphate synthase n=1 Tax=Candidatus Termititenax dinenymphae TaxID=2218523 RepID=A0A388TK05_9BACT|nr:thiamine-phosphate pyrophosphorylase [Candidatus Termititenax dinenymphae]
MNKSLRLLDANINRAREGLRVLEDISRFILDDIKLTEHLKSIRHTLKDLINVPDSLLVASRGSDEDVARERPVPRRSDLRNIITANAKRTAEALRVLEEFSVRGSEIKDQRYQVYDLEKIIAAKVRLMRPFDHDVYVISDDPAVLITAVQNGARVVQLRDKVSDAETIYQKLLQVKQLQEKYDFVLIVNDYPELVLRADVDGVHVGQDTDPAALRKIIGTDKILGWTTHKLEQAQKAVELGVNYISAGPIWATPTKPGRQPVGLEYVREVAAQIDLPFVAIGGINLTNVQSVVEAGANTIGVVRSADDIAKYLQVLRPLCH